MTLIISRHYARKLHYIGKIEIMMMITVWVKGRVIARFVYDSQPLGITTVTT